MNAIDKAEFDKVFNSIKTDFESERKAKVDAYLATIPQVLDKPFTEIINEIKVLTDIKINNDLQKIEGEALDIAVTEYLDLNKTAYVGNLGLGNYFCHSSD